jgi:hypothetical protein
MIGGLALCLGLLAVPALAADAYVRIAAPADGATLDGRKPAKLVYEVQPGTKGHHVHVFVDGKEVGILRRLQGSYTLEALSPGQRTVCIKIANRAHVPTGVEQCIKVRVQ